MKKLALAFLFVASALCGQTSYSLQVPTGATTPGQVAVVTATMSSTAAARPAGLQLTLNYNAADISAVSAVVGSSASAAGKQVDCAQQQGGGYKCVLTGMNVNTIADGPIVIFSLTVNPATTHVNTQISLSDDMGATVAADAITIADVPFVVVAFVPSKCDLNGDGAVNVTDVQSAISQALGRVACTAGDADGDGKCTIRDIVGVIAASLGGACPFR